MRIPSGTTNRYIYFVAVDSTDFTTRETGLSSFSVYRSRNGGTAAAMTTPTINETDATNMPGVYELLLDEDTTLTAGNDTEELSLHITCAGMAPVTRVVELYRPETTEGNTLDVTSTGAGGIDWGNVENQSTSVDLSSTAISLCDTVTANTDMRGTDSALLASSAPTNFSDLAITVTTGLVSIGTNNDKAGYSISGTIQNLDDLDTAQDAQHATTLAAIPSAGSIADAVWTEQVSDHSGTTGSTAESLNAAGAAGDPWTTSLPGAYGAGSAGNIIGNLNDLSSGDVAAALVAYDAPTLAEMAAEFTAIKGATFDTATDSLEAIRNATLDASGIRSAVGLASANLDTQLSSVAGDVSSVKADVDDGGRTDLLIDSILQHVSTNIPAAIPSAAAIATSVHTTQMTEDYPAVGVAPTLEQGVMLILQGLLERSVSGTTETVKKLDGSTTAATFTLDDATSPTSKTRAT